MSQEETVRVFILGAGCSVKSGYPPGKDLAGELRKFLGEISEPAKCPSIVSSIEATLKELDKRPLVETLDQLARESDEEVAKLGQSGAWRVDIKWASDKAAECQNAVRNAKIATTAMFLFKEAEARASGLPGYEDFINKLLGGSPWDKALDSANCHVLSFNYDRLFEMAFLDRFRDFQGTPHFLYGGDVLNSGFLGAGFDMFEPPRAKRFSFLKLHGSVGWWVGRQPSPFSTEDREERQYGLLTPIPAGQLTDIEQDICECSKSKLDPLLVFPRERQDAQKYSEEAGKPCGHPWAKYIDVVWRHAVELVTRASEIRVIGYSFNPIDSRYVVDRLLSQATCEKIDIQDLNCAAVERNLKAYPVLKGRWRFHHAPF